jgi:hypothetical protein
MHHPEGPWVSASLNSVLVMVPAVAGGYHVATSWLLCGYLVTYPVLHRHCPGDVMEW